MAGNGILNFELCVKSAIAHPQCANRLLAPILNFEKLPPLLAHKRLPVWRNVSRTGLIKVHDLNATA
jgi:hypothetical protein